MHARKTYLIMTAAICCLMLAGTSTLAYNGIGSDAGRIIRNGRGLVTELEIRGTNILLLDQYQMTEGEIWYIPTKEVSDDFIIPLLFDKGNPYIPLVRDPEEVFGSSMHLRISIAHEDEFVVFSISEYSIPDNNPRGRELMYYTHRIALPMEREERTGVLYMPIIELDEALVVPLVLEIHAPGGCDNPVTRRSMLQNLEEYETAFMAWEETRPRG